MGQCSSKPRPVIGSEQITILQLSWQRILDGTPAFEHWLSTAYSGAKNDATIENTQTQSPAGPLTFFHDVFYQKFFDLVPSAALLFTNHLHQQARMLGYLMHQLLPASTSGRADAALAAVARSHAPMGLEARMYEKLGESILYAVKVCLGEEYTPAVDKAWTQTVHRVLSVLVPEARASERKLRWNKRKRAFLTGFGCIGAASTVAVKPAHPTLPHLSSSMRRSRSISPHPSFSCSARRDEGTPLGQSSTGAAADGALGTGHTGEQLRTSLSSHRMYSDPSMRHSSSLSPRDDRDRDQRDQRGDRDRQLSRAREERRTSLVSEQYANPSAAAGGMRKSNSNGGRGFNDFDGGPVRRVNSIDGSRERRSSLERDTDAPAAALRRSTSLNGHSDGRRSSLIDSATGQPMRRVVSFDPSLGGQTGLAASEPILVRPAPGTTDGEGSHNSSSNQLDGSWSSGLSGAASASNVLWGSAGSLTGALPSPPAEADGAAEDRRELGVTGLATSAAQVAPGYGPVAIDVTDIPPKMGGHVPVTAWGTGPGSTALALDRPTSGQRPLATMTQASVHATRQHGHHSMHRFDSEPGDYNINDDPPASVLAAQGRSLSEPMLRVPTGPSSVVVPGDANSFGRPTSRSSPRSRPGSGLSQGGLEQSRRARGSASARSQREPVQVVEVEPASTTAMAAPPVQLLTPTGVNSGQAAASKASVLSIMLGLSPPASSGSIKSSPDPIAGPRPARPSSGKPTQSSGATVSTFSGGAHITDGVLPSADAALGPKAPGPQAPVVTVLARSMQPRPLSSQPAHIRASFSGPMASAGTVSLTPVPEDYDGEKTGSILFNK